MQKYFALLAIIFIVAETCFARWAKPDEAHYTSFFEYTYVIDQDGSFNEDILTVHTILTSEAREYLKNLYFLYSADTTKNLKVSAKTVFGNTEYPIRAQDISDKPLADDNSGFDNNNRVNIAFSNIKIGSKLHLHYKNRLFAPNFPKHFFYVFSLENFAPYEKGSKFVFYSKLSSPLKVSFRKPEAFIMKESIEKGMQKISIEVRDTSFYKVVEEPYSSNNPNTSVPKFVVSSARNYGDFLNPYAELYEAKLTQELPTQFIPILNSAKKLKGFEEQANIVMSEVMNQIHYMGDWRSIKGRLVPRDFSVLARTGFGDCKDFAALTTKLLRMLGYDAHVAIVYRSKIPYEREPLAINHSNHAIVHVSWNGKSFWLDPTNPTAFTGIREDIAQRQAIILKKSGVVAEEIPMTSPQDEIVDLRSELTFQEQGRANIRMHADFAGRAANSIQDYLFGKLATEIEHIAVTEATSEARIHRINSVRIPSFQTRLPIPVSYDVDVDYFPPMNKTSVGPGFIMNASGMHYLSKIDSQNYVNDITLGLPHSVTTRVILKNQQIVGTPLVCKTSSPWLKLTREISQVGCDIKITGTALTTAYKITNEELKSAQFQQLQEDLQNCWDQFVIVFKTSNPQTCK